MQLLRLGNDVFAREFALDGEDDLVAVSTMIAHRLEIRHLAGGVNLDIPIARIDAVCPCNLLVAMSTHIFLRIFFNARELASSLHFLFSSSLLFLFFLLSCCSLLFLFLLIPSSSLF